MLMAKTISPVPPPAPAAPPVSEQAAREFLSRVWDIAGVRSVHLLPDRPLAEQLITVYVPALRSETATHVFELEGELLRRYRGARLEIRVRGIDKHRGATGGIAGTE
jgi:hypothetical protein